MFGLSSLQALLAAAALSALLSGIGSGIIVHKLDNGRYLTLQRDYATAEARAIQASKDLQKKQDAVVLEAAVNEAQAQVRIVEHTSVVTKEIVRYVKDNVPCVSYGFVRVLNAEVLGVAPDQLSLPANQLDDSCTPLTSSYVAGWIVDNYDRAIRNAEQLNALSAVSQALATP